MRIKDGFVMRTVGGSNIVVPTGKLSRQYHNMITLNDAGKLLFEALENEQTTDNLVQILLDNYDVDKTTAESDALKFIASMTEAGIIE